MEQGGISILSPPNNTENSVGKTKGTTSISLPSSPRLQSAKEKLKSPWFKELFQTDCSAWDSLRIAIAELIGTAILVFVGCMGCVGSLGNEPSLVQASFTFGFAVMIVIQSLGHISDAHINPAITIGSIVLGKKSLRAASVYIISQILGGVIGFGLLKAVTPQSLLYGNTGPDTQENFCITDIHKDISIIQGLLAEIIATGILMLMTCAIWDIRNEKNTDSVAIKFGLAVAGLCMAFAPYTQCSMNPARSFGPAVWNNNWSHHWIFWFGPVAGSLLASVLYRSIFSPRKSKSSLTECCASPAVNGAEAQKTEI